MACGIEKPSKTGTACVTPSPESKTMPVVRPEEYLGGGESYSSSDRLSLYVTRAHLYSQTQYSLDAGEEGRHIKGFEEDLSGDVSILSRI